MARLVLTDASPLIGLARVGELHWLRILFGNVQVTPEVRAEVLPGKGLDDEHTIAAALQEGWLQTLPQTPPGPDYPHLGDGEASCLRTALAHSDSCLLMLDDRLARREAHRAGITVVGIAGIVGLARRRGLITSAREIFNRLMHCDFRISAEVIRSILNEVEPPDRA